MNLILLDDGDFVAPDRVRIEGRRLEHARRVHRAVLGDELRVGRVDGPVGVGLVERIDADALELAVVLTGSPPPPSRVTLAVALPRPPTLHKVLQHGTAMGVKRFDFFHSKRVEKSFWSSSALIDRALRDHLILGLEQARDTVMPEVVLHRRFRPFVEDELAARAASSSVLVADPAATLACPREPEGRVTLVLGPEGGFVPFEVELMARLGFLRISLGPRILRVEAAAIALLARLGS